MIANNYLYAKQNINSSFLAILLKAAIKYHKGIKGKTEQELP